MKQSVIVFVLLLTVAISAMPGGDAATSISEGNYKNPIKPTQTLIKKPHSTISANPQTYLQGPTYGLVNVRAGNLSYRIRLYPSFSLVYDSSHSTFLIEYIHLHKNAKTAELYTSSGYVLSYVRDKDEGGSNSKGQRYIRIVDTPDEYGTMWVKDSEISIDTRNGKKKLFVEDKKKKETGTDKYYTLSNSISNSADDLSYVYDSDGNLTSIIPAVGPTVALSYPAPNTIAVGLENEPPRHLITLNSVGDVAELATTYSIPGVHSSERLDNVLTVVTYSFSYNANGQVTSISDSQDQLLLNAIYQIDGKVSALTLPGGNWQYQYTANASTVTFSNIERASISETISYEQIPGGTRETIIDCLGYSTANMYNVAGDIIRTIDKNGNLWLYAYDTNHKLISMTTPLNGIWTNQYGLFGKIISQQDAENNYKYWQYNASGDMINATNALNYSNNYSYDSHHQIASHTDPENIITTFNNSYSGNLLLSTVIGNQENHQTAVFYEYDPGTGEQYISDIIEASGARWKFTYSSTGEGLVRKEAIDPQNNIVSGYYDPIPCNGTYVHNYAYLRDARCDNCPEANQHRYWIGKDPNTGLILNTRDQDGFEIRYQYANYWGNWHLSSITKYNTANTKWTTLSYGLTVPNWDRTDLESSASITRYTYNCRGELITESDPIGNTVSYAYDGNGNLISKIFPNSGVLTYQYDAENRLIQINYPGAKVETYTYDRVGNLIFVNGLDTSVTNDYDAGYRLKSRHQGNSENEISYWVSYDYYKNDLLKTIIHDKHVWSYAYDSLGRPIEVTNPFNETFHISYYFATAKIKSLVFPNDAQIEYTYDMTNNVKDIINKHSDGSIIKSYHYTYDGNGLVESLTEESRNIVYFISDNRLKLQRMLFSPGDVYDFSYDSRGNTTAVLKNGARYRTFIYNSDDTLAHRSGEPLNFASYIYDYSTYDGRHSRIMREETHTFLWDMVKTYEFDYRELLTGYKKYKGPQPEYLNLGKEIFYTPITNAIFKEDSALQISGIVSKEEYSKRYYLNDMNGLLFDKISKVTRDNEGVEANYSESNYYTKSIDQFLSARKSFPLQSTSKSQYFLKNLSETVIGIVDDNDALNYLGQYDIYGKVLTNTNPTNILHNSAFYDSDLEQYSIANVHYDPNAQSIYGEPIDALIEKEYKKEMDDENINYPIFQAAFQQISNINVLSLRTLYNKSQAFKNNELLKIGGYTHTINPAKIIYGWCKIKNGSLECQTYVPPSLTYTNDLELPRVPMNMSVGGTASIANLPAGTAISLSIEQKYQGDDGDATIHCPSGSSPCIQNSDHQISFTGNGTFQYEVRGVQNSYYAKDMSLKSKFFTAVLNSIDFTVRTYPKCIKIIGDTDHSSSSYNRDFIFSIESENGNVSNISDYITIKRNVEQDPDGRNRSAKCWGCNIVVQGDYYNCYDACYFRNQITYPAPPYAKNCLTDMTVILNEGIAYEGSSPVYLINDAEITKNDITTNNMLVPCDVYIWAQDQYGNWGWYYSYTVGNCKSYYYFKMFDVYFHDNLLIEDINNNCNENSSDHFWYGFYNIIQNVNNEAIQYLQYWDDNSWPYDFWRTWPVALNPTCP